MLLVMCARLAGQHVLMIVELHVVVFAKKIHITFVFLSKIGAQTFGETPGRLGHPLPIHRALRIEYNRAKVVDLLHFVVAPLGHKHQYQQIHDEYDKKVDNKQQMLRRSDIGKIRYTEQFVVGKAVVCYHPEGLCEFLLWVGLVQLVAIERRYVGAACGHVLSGDTQVTTESGVFKRYIFQVKLLF